MRYPCFQESMEAASSVLRRNSVALRNGIQLPRIAFGTYKVGVVPSSASENGGSAAELRGTVDVVLDAVATGYRCFDCAQFYANEASVGEALTKSDVAREDLFLISKVWNDAIYSGPDAVKAQVRRACVDLRTDYIDLFLVHWPVPGKHAAAYAALEELQAEGLIKSVGVANYDEDDLAVLLSDERVRCAPAVNQIEINPFLYRREMIAAFEAAGVVLQGYRTLCQGKEDKVGHPAIVDLANFYHCTPPQLLARWSSQHGFASVVKTENRARMVENLDISLPRKSQGEGGGDGAISRSDMARLDALTSEESRDAHRALHAQCIVRDTPLDVLRRVTSDLAREKFAIVRAEEMERIVRQLSAPRSDNADRAGDSRSESEAEAEADADANALCSLWDDAVPQTDAADGSLVYPSKSTLTSYYDFEVPAGPGQHPEEAGFMDAPRTSRNNWNVGSSSNSSSNEFVVERIDPTTSVVCGAASHLRVHKSWPLRADGNRTLRALQRFMIEVIAHPQSGIDWHGGEGGGEGEDRIGSASSFEVMQSAFRVVHDATPLSAPRTTAAGAAASAAARTAPGDPSPEGVHQDAAQLTAVVLIDRRNLAMDSGGNRVWSLKQRCGKAALVADDAMPGSGEPGTAELLARVVLSDRFDTLLLLDREVKHEALPIAPIDPTQTAERDVLTFEVR